MVSSAKHAHFTSFGKTKILYRVYIFPHMQQLQFSSQCIHWIFIREQIGYLDILPTAKAGGFLDTDGICLLKCRSYDASPKKVDAPTFKMFFAAFLSRS